jgi:Luciferase-like monooxygenase
VKPLGLALPVGRQIFEDQWPMMEQAVDAGFTGLWFRDLPGHELTDPDAGTGRDPFAYLAYCAARFPRLPELGTAVIGAGFRPPMTTARACVTLTELCGPRFILGVGASDKPAVAAAFGATKAAKQELVYGFTRDLWSFLHGQAELPANLGFVVPDDFIPPRLLLASTNLDLWRSLAANVQGGMLWFLRPAAFRELTHSIRALVPEATISMSINLWLDPDAASMPRIIFDYRPCTLAVGEANLSNLFKVYLRLGLDRLLIHFPSTEGIDRQFRLVVAAWTEAQEAVPQPEDGDMPLGAGKGIGGT